MLDFTKAGSYKAYPDGDYKVVIKGWEKIKSSTGNDRIKWTAEILNGDHAGGEISDFHSLLDQAAWRLCNFLLAGWMLQVSEVPESFRKVEFGSEKFGLFLDSMKHRMMWWKVELGEYQGKPKNDVLEYTPCNVSEQEPSNLANLEDVPAWVTKS